MSKKKERTYNSYRIEQLGPRLMMDATVSDWQDDLDNLDTSAATYIVNESDTLKQKEFLNISWNDENGSRYAKIDDLLWGSEFSQLNWGSLYNSVKSSVQAKLDDVSSGSTLLSASDIASAIGNGSVSVQTGMLDHKIGRFTVGDSYIANYSAYAENNLLKIEIDGLTCIDTDKDLGNDKLSVDITDYGVETNFSSVGNRYSISTGWILTLDGNINNNTQDSAMARFAIETAFEQDSNDAVRFGILDLTGDQDENEDLIIRKELLIDATGGISEADKIQLDLSLKIAEYANDFTNMNGLSENVHLYKSFDDASLVSSNLVQLFTNISMGKILGKLQELSSKLSKINSDVDFGGLLAQNANAILNL